MNNIIETSLNLESYKSVIQWSRKTLHDYQDGANFCLCSKYALPLRPLI